MKNKNTHQFLDFYKKFKKHRVANVALILIAIELLAVIFLPFVLNLSPDSITDTFKAAPSAEHILGTDTTGRDVLSRIIYGGRISLLVGFCATAISVIVGLPLGVIAGYYRGVSETIIMRLADIFQSFPSMVLVLVMVAIFGKSLPILILLIGLLAWPQTARLIYGRVLSVRRMEYIEAAKVGGESNLKILVKNVIPNSIAPLWMSFAFQISSAMLTESALSFLGAGVQPPTSSWGNIIQQASNVIVMKQNPWIWLPAGICLMVTVVCINFVGEGIRDALDPKMKR